MSFVSWAFVGFFAMVLLGLRLMPTRESRQLLLLVSNVVFYGSGTAWHLLVLAVPSIVDYAAAVRIEATEDPAARKRWLTLSIACNLGLLAYFKYADFFVDTVAHLLGTSTAPLDVALPIGISFFTFKTMSYTIDVYRREIPACRSLWRYAMFVSFFPELVAGPIVRASIFLPQMDRSLAPRWRRTATGLQIVLLGLAKKLLIADRLATFSDAVFSRPGAFSQATVAAAVVAYSLQIYCDFSGYSDMAIGTARVVGFDLPENFDMPYLSTSITEFWRRWHMTLSRWLRDYLYIPLGGNRRGPIRTYVNLVVTMLLGGLWHGANWTFVAWGLWHGIGLATHKLWHTHRPMGERSGMWKVVSWAATYAFVCVGWVLFRSPDFATATIVLGKIAGLTPGGATWAYAPFLMALAVVAMAHGVGVLARQGAISRSLRTTREAGGGVYVTVRQAGFTAGALVTAILIALFLFAPLHLSPFIYFRF
jgi:alginate O-acetyltransferase complex protein AlgI